MKRLIYLNGHFWLAGKADLAAAICVDFVVVSSNFNKIVQLRKTNIKAWANCLETQSTGKKSKI